MCAKLLGIIGLLLALEGCCLCLVPCNGQWLAVGLKPNEVEIVQSGKQVPEENKEKE